MGIEITPEKSSAIDSFTPETKTTEQARNMAVNAAAFQNPEMTKEGFVEEKKGPHEPVSQKSENRIASATKFNKAKTDKRENPANVVEMASEGEEERAPVRPSPKKPLKKGDAIKYTVAERSSEEDKIEVHSKLDDSTAPKQKDSDKKLDGKSLEVENYDAEPAAGTMKREDSDPPGADPITTFDKMVFVGHLNFRTSKGTIEKHFSLFGEVVRVDLPLRHQSSINKGYAFVTFKEASSAKKALADRFPEIDSLKILLEPVKDTFTKTALPNLLFVGGLHKFTQTLTIEQHFSRYGKVTNVTMPWNNILRKSKGYAFVSFETTASLQSALEEVQEIDGKKVVMRFETVAGKRKSEDSDQPWRDSRLFVRQLSYTTSEDTVQEHFSQFGEVVGVFLPRQHGSSKNKGYAVVTFKEASSAKKALADCMQEIDSEKIVLQPHKVSFVKEAFPKPSQPNELFVDGLDISTQRRTLDEYFSKYGKVTKVTLPWKRLVRENKGYSFITFEFDASLHSALEEDHEVDGKKITARPRTIDGREIGLGAGKAEIDDNTAAAATKREVDEEKDECEEKEVKGEEEDCKDNQAAEDEGFSDAEAEGEAEDRVEEEEDDSAQQDGEEESVDDQVDGDDQYDT